MTDYFNELPADPEAAFVFLEAGFRADSEAQFTMTAASEGWSPSPVSLVLFLMMCKI